MQILQQNVREEARTRHLKLKFKRPTTLSSASLSALILEKTVMETANPQFPKIPWAF